MRHVNIYSEEDIQMRFGYLQMSDERINFSLEKRTSDDDDSHLLMVLRTNRFSGEEVKRILLN